MPSNPIIDVSIELYEQNVILDFETGLFIRNPV